MRITITDWIIELDETEERLDVTVRDASDSRVLLHDTVTLVPGRRSGFRPGIAIVRERSVLFVGGGDTIRAHQLRTGELLWDERVEHGFLAWERHGGIMFMSAELELAAYDLRGKRLWSQFVEPPWTFTLEGTTVVLDVMGVKSRFPMATGPGG